MKKYFFGFLWSLFLTIIPFILVSCKIFPSFIKKCIIFICAFIQIIIQFRYFFHLNFSKKYIWIIYLLLFTGIIVLIIVIGSIWIMNNLNH